MYTYEFEIIICGGSPFYGTLTVKAWNKERAYEEALDIIYKRLTTAFPEFEIPFDAILCKTDEPVRYVVA